MNNKSSLICGKIDISMKECTSSRKCNLGPALSFWELLLQQPEADFYAF